MAVTAAGCASPPLVDVASFDGVWEGRAVLSRGDSACAQATRYVLTVREGNVAGEVRRSTDPEAIADRFRAYIETDGEMVAVARPGGVETVVRGRFQGRSFVGNTQSTTCTHRLQLTRRSS